MPDAPPPSQQFEFQHAVFNVAAVLDAERLIVRVGMKTVVAPIARLQHLHVLSGAREDAQELLLTYATPKGKLKRARIFSDRGEPGFDHLVAALLARRPDIDIRGLPQAEVWERVGAKPLEWVVLPLVMAVGWLVLAVLFAPMLVHGLDGGHAQVTVAELTAAHPGTRNLTVIGRPVPEASVQVQAPDTGQTRLWMPLVGPGWQPGDPVTVVLRARYLTAARLDAVLAADRHAGMLRDLLWEGLEGKRRAELLAKGVRLAPTVRLVELGATPRTDLLAALGVLGFLALIIAGATWALWRRRKPAPTRASLAGRPPDAAT
ncbi:MAG: hypothetical protein H6702_10355 [Myxococcales bacterium]|nr:hypothetical protein [Myxococcales bacterium]